MKHQAPIKTFISNFEQKSIIFGDISLVRSGKNMTIYIANYTKYDWIRIVQKNWLTSNLNAREVHSPIYSYQFDTLVFCASAVTSCQKQDRCSNLITAFPKKSSWTKSLTVRTEFVETCTNKKKLVASCIS